MPAIEFHTFRKVNCVDQLKKSVLPSGCLNLKLTIYSDQEYSDLTVDYRNIVFDNTMAEFEYIIEVDHNSNKLEFNKLYAFKIFEKNYMEGTDFFGTILQVLRTEKLKNGRNRIHYLGVRTVAQTFDQLNIFSNYSPKIYVIVGKEKTVIKRVFNQSEEEDLKELFPVKDYDLYDINKYLDRNSKTFRDGALTEMQPDLV